MFFKKLSLFLFFSALFFSPFLWADEKQHCCDSCEQCCGGLFGKVECVVKEVMDGITPDLCCEKTDCEEEEMREKREMEEDSMMNGKMGF